MRKPNPIDKIEGSGTLMTMLYKENTKTWDTTAHLGQKKNIDVSGFKQEKTLRVSRSENCFILF